MPQSDFEGGAETEVVVMPPGGITAYSSGNKAATAGTATIPKDPSGSATAGRLNYITGFICTASGATAGLPVNVTVTGVAGGTMTFTFTFPAGVLVGANPLVVNFPHPMPAAAYNTDIVVTLPSSGAGGTNAAVVAFGFLY